MRFLNFPGSLLLVAVFANGAHPVAGFPRSGQSTLTPSKGDTVIAARSAQPLRPIVSQQGNYSILVPAGWSMSQVPGAALATVMSPPGQKAPAAYLLLLPVSDIRYQMMLNRCTQQYARNPLSGPNMISDCVVPAVRAQLQDSSFPWKPDQAVEAILQLYSGGNVQFRVTSMRDVSPGQVQYEIASVENGLQFAHWGQVNVSYLPNPLFSQAGHEGVTSLAMVTGCRSVPQRREDFRETCARVLGSFRPAANWGQMIAAQFMQTYQQEEQILLKMGSQIPPDMAYTRNMIGNFGAAQQQMQNQAFQNIQNAQLKSGENWIATLGGRVNMVNPATGEVKSLPAGYGNYCDDGAGNTLAGPDVVRGMSVGKSLACETMLQPW